MKNAFVLLLLYSTFSFAQEVKVTVVEKTRQNSFDLGVGSKLQLLFKTTGEKKETIFLGRMVNQSGENVEFLFLDEKKTRISMIDPANLEGFRKSQAQPIIQPIDQKGSTCLAYAFFHYWNQLYVSGLAKNDTLVKVMSSDRERMRFLEETIEIYYIQNRTNITNLMKNFGKRYGFNCKNNVFTTPKEAANFIYRETLKGNPVLIDFNISKNMLTSTYEITDFEKPLSSDPRLWLPRKRGQRMTSGHAIVGASAFISNGRRKILVLDSDWSEPRVWDLDKYLSAKTAVKEMGFHTCD